MTAPANIDGKELTLLLFFSQLPLFLNRKLCFFLCFFFALVFFPFITHIYPSSNNKLRYRFLPHHSTLTPIRWYVAEKSAGIAAG